MIPEKEREALMRLTMCAREECFMCGYKDKCDFEFQYDLATKNMNILADALRKDKPQHGYMWTCSKCGLEVHSDYGKCPRCGELKDEPQSRLDKCYKCKWWNYSYGCKCKKGICEFEPIDEPQTERNE